MTISINQYEYDYFAAVGSFLRSQSIKQATRYLSSCFAVESAIQEFTFSLEKISKIAKAVILGIANAFITVYGTPISWLIGKGITFLSSTKINYASLPLKPTLLPQPQIGDTPLYTEFSYLREEFIRRNLHSRQEYLPLRAVGKTPIEGCLELMLNQIHVGQVAQVRDQHGHDEFVAKMRVYLSAIMVKIQESGTADEVEEQALVKGQALIALADASNVCAPTWLEAAEKVYNTLYAPPDARNKVLQYVQKLKEELLTEYIQIDLDGRHWHGLSYMRNFLGDELGLNENTSGLDPYAGENKGPLINALFKQLFIERYDDVNRIVSSVQAQIEAKPADWRCYYNFLVEIVQGMGVAEAEGVVVDQFVDTDYKPNFKGVNLMLRNIGILR